MYKYNITSREPTLYLSDFIIVIGTLLENKNEPLSNFIRYKLEDINTTIIYFSPIDYNRIVSSNMHFIKYEIESEEIIFALLLKYFLNNQNNLINNFIEGLDIGHLSAEINIGEEEFEDIKELSISKRKHSIFVGKDVVEHNKSINILNILNQIHLSTSFDIFLCYEYWTKYHSLIKTKNFTKELSHISELNDYNGVVVYKYKKSTSNNNILIGGETLLKLLNIIGNDIINIKFSQVVIKSKFILDTNLKGNICLLIYSNDINCSSYVYQSLDII